MDIKLVDSGDIVSAPAFFDLHPCVAFPLPLTDEVLAHFGARLAPQEPEQPEPTHPQLTSLEYLDLFTEAEQLAVVGATMTVPAVKLWYDRMLAASFVSYADPRTEAGLQALVDAGLLQPQRKTEIAAAMQAT